MTIKYEPVFGDQSLFDNASDDAVLAIKDTTSGRIHFFANKGWIKSGLKHERHIGTSENEIAMRRIIKTPTWTWEDKKAGRLPEVGCNVSSDAYGYVCSVVAIDSNSRHVWCQFPDQSVGSCMIFEINPIETPEEKAQREQEEFVASFNSEKYSNPTLYREGLRDAYRKLKAPTND